MVTSGNTTALETNFPGHLGHYDLRLDIPAVIDRISPLLATFGMLSNKYKGDLGPASEQVTFRSVAVGDAAYRWTEFDPTKNRLTAINNGAGYNTTVTSIVVDSAADIKANYLIVNTRTREVMKVTNVSSNTLTVIRGWGATVATATSYPAGLNSVAGVAMLDDDVIRIMGPAVQQFSTNVDSSYNTETVREGATQILRRDISISGTRYEQEKSSKLKTDTFKERKAQATLDIFEDLENCFFFGKLMRTANSGNLGSVAQDGNNLTTTDGIFHVISAYASENINNANTLGVSDTSGGQNVNIDKLDDMTFILSRRPGDRTNFISSDMKKAIQKLNNASNGYRFPLTSDKHDLSSRVDGYIGSHGKIRFNVHPIYDEDTTTGATVTSVSMKNIKMTHVNNRVVKPYDNSEENNRDGKASYVLGEHGLCIAHAKTHFQFDNFTALGV